MARPLGEVRQAKRVVVVYRYGLLRDLVARLLTDAGADVVGQIAAEDVSLSLLSTFDADVVILDETAASPSTANFDQISSLSWIPNCVSKVISVGVNDRAMVAFSRHVVDDATVEQLIDETLDQPSAKLTG
jgi:hypothetical protein